MNYIYITGTGKGIGASIARELLKDKDNRVFGISRENEIEASNFSFNKVDLAELHIVERMKFKALENPSKIVLINNAGMLGDINYMGKLTSHEIQQVYNVNLLAPTLLINQFIERYRDVNCEKTIINISSGASTNPYEAWSTYCASKAGLEMLSRVLIKEEEKQIHPFKVFSIAPGVVDTNMQEQIRATPIENFPHKEKFIDLKKNDQLFDRDFVASKIVEIIAHPSRVIDPIFRITK